jgi:hypothetical protein
MNVPLTNGKKQMSTRKDFDWPQKKGSEKRGFPMKKKETVLLCEPWNPVSFVINEGDDCTKIPVAVLSCAIGMPKGMLQACMDKYDEHICIDDVAGILRRLHWKPQEIERAVEQLKPEPIAAVAAKPIRFVAIAANTVEDRWKLKSLDGEQPSSSSKKKQNRKRTSEFDDEFQEFATEMQYYLSSAAVEIYMKSAEFIAMQDDIISKEVDKAEAYAIRSKVVITMGDQ